MANVHCYREIRPALTEHHSAPGPSPGSAIGSSQTPASPASEERRTRRNAWVACENCKKRKTKCTADRPKCSACRDKGFDCRYTSDPSESRTASLKRKHRELEHQNDSLRSFFHAIQTMPEAQSYDVLKRIRGGASVEDILNQIREGYLLLQLSEGAGDQPCQRDMSNVTNARRGLPTPANSYAGSVYGCSRTNSLDDSVSSSMSPQQPADKRPGL